MHTKRWDIFCRVVDNFGDAGVCWRLARQLAAEHALDVCLWIDRVDVLAQLWPEVNASVVTQCVEGVTVHRWQADSLPREDAAVVIEAFACELPESAVAAMSQREHPPLWINLEYLSAEPWVEGSHALWSVHAASGLRKLFFFPGFTKATGGLLCEQNLEARRQAFLASERAAFLQAQGAPLDAQARYASVWAYPQPPLAGWLRSLAEGSQPWVCLIPEGHAWDEVAKVCGMPLAHGQPVQKGNLTAVGLPFLSQDDYDRLLWACDFNAVRGEDSFVRAQWAGRPLLWQPYRQDAAAHEAKLEAFLSRYAAAWPAPAAEAMTALHRSWSAGEWNRQAWERVLKEWADCGQGAESWRDTQSELPDLASKLVQFYSDWL